MLYGVIQDKNINIVKILNFIAGGLVNFEYHHEVIPFWKKVNLMVPCISTYLASPFYEIDNIYYHRSIICFQDNEDMCLKREILDEVITTCQNGNDNKALISLLGNVLTKSSSLCASFSSNENMVDLEAVREMYDRLYTLNDDVVENTIVNCLETLSTDLIVQIKRKSNKFVDYRLFLIMFENPYMNQPEYMNHALPRFCQALSSIPIATAVLLIKHWSKQSKELLKTKVETLQQLITLRVIMGPSADSSSKCVNDDDAIVTAAKCLKFLFYASLYGGEHQTSSTINHIPISSQGEDYRDPFEETLKINAADCRKPLLPLDEFINEPLNDAIAVDRDFTYYKTREGFSFKECNFILTTSTKSTWMFYDNRVNMLQERRMTHFYSLLRGEPAAPYLKLTVHRDNLIQDALVNVSLAGFLLAQLPCLYPKVRHLFRLTDSNTVEPLLTD